MGGSSSPQPAAASESGPKVTMLSAGEASSRNPRKKKRGSMFDDGQGGATLGGGSTMSKATWAGLGGMGMNPPTLMLGN